MEAPAIVQQNFEDTELCDDAAKHLTDLMQEYLAIKKIEREVGKWLNADFMIANDLSEHRRWFTSRCP